MSYHLSNDGSAHWLSNSEPDKHAGCVLLTPAGWL